MLRFVLALFVVLLLSTAHAQEPTYANARDAYLEGWFQETAQRDLQSALTAYRACVAKGDDRELAAKATLRMALIARALGDEDAAKAQLAQVVEKYADTAAAESAKEASDTKAAVSPTGAAELAVAEATVELGGMFVDGERATPGAVERVFRALGAKDFLDAALSSGKYAYAVIMRLKEQGRVDVLTELALANDSTAQRVVDTLANSGPVVQFGGRLLPLVERPAFPRGALAVLLATQTDAESLHRLAELIPGLEPLHAQNVVAKLDANPAPEAAACTDAALDVLMRTATQGDWLYTPETAAKPSGRGVATRYAKSPLKVRVVFVENFALGRGWNGKSLDAASDPLFQQMLVDPEPWIRRTAIERLIKDPVESIADDGVRRLFAEAPPWDISAIQTRMSSAASGPSFDALFNVPQGAAREWAYHQALLSRSAQSVLTTGLERGDPELLSAFFDPREFVQNGKITYQGSPINSAEVPCFNTAIKAALSALPDDVLLVRLARAAAAHPRASLRRAAVRMYLNLSAERDLASAILAFSKDALPAVRKSAASARLPPDALHFFSIDASTEVAVTAIAQITDVALIQELARTAPLDRARQVLRRALEVGDKDALTMLMLREGMDEDIVIDAFSQLVKSDPSAYSEALVVAERGGANKMRPFVIDQLGMLASDSKPLQDIHQQFQSAKDAGEFSAALNALNGAADEVDRAWRAQRRAHLLQQQADAGQFGDSMAKSVGENLAQVADRDLLVSKLSESPGSGPSRVAAWALATLGEKASLIALLDDRSTSTSLEWLIGPLLAAGARDEVLAATFDGRLPAEDAWSKFLEAQDFVGAARLRYAPPERHIVMVRMDMTDETQTALVAALEAAGDVETLLRVASLDALPSAIRALLRMGQSEALFAQLPSFPDAIAWNVAQVLAKLTRAQPVDPNQKPWPQFSEERAAQIEAWRAALAKK